MVSRVLNLQDEYPNVDHDKFCQEIEKTFIDYYGSNRPEK